MTVLKNLSDDKNNLPTVSLSARSEQSAQAVLLLRVNTLRDTWETDYQLNFLRERFPGRPLYTLVDSDAEEVLVDPDGSRFDKVLMYSLHSERSGLKGYFELVRFLRFWNIGSVVVSAHAVSGLDYSRLIVLGLLLPGKTFLLEPGEKIQPLSSPFISFKVIGAVAGSCGWAVRKLSFIVTRRLAACVSARTTDRVLSTSDKEGARRILCIRLDHIGDFVMTLPAIAALRESFPKARIDILTQRSNSELLQEYDSGDVIEYGSSRYGSARVPRSSTFEFFRLIRQLRSRRYDMAFDFRGDGEARRIAFLSAAKRRIGLFPSPLWSDEPGEWLLGLTNVVRPDPDVHITTSCLKLLEGAGVTAARPAESLKVGALALSKATEYLKTHGISHEYAVVHMYSRDPIKNWLPESLTSVIDHLTGISGLSVILTGGEDDYIAVETVRSTCSNSSRIVNSAGELSLDVLSAILSQARLMVTIDTGPMHIAAALGVPIVGLFLAEHATRFYPYGQMQNILCAESSPSSVSSTDANSLLPLKSITVKQVVEKIDYLLSQPGKSGS